MYAITGASGKLGNHVAERLLARLPAHEVRLGSRQAGRLASFAARGAETMAADFDDAASLARLFAGRRVALIISGDAANDRRRVQHEAAFEAARAASVERIVYTSFTNPSIQSRFTVAASHAESEDMLHSLGVPFTILRNNLYAENVMIEAARTSGVLAQHGSLGKAAYVSCHDVAAATVGALMEAQHANRVYEITGPTAGDHFQTAALLSKAWQREIKVVELSPGEYAKALVQRGLPEFIVEVLTSLHAAIAAGEYASVSSDAARLAGRPIEPVEDFLWRAWRAAAAVAGFNTIRRGISLVSNSLTPD